MKFSFFIAIALITLASNSYGQAMFDCKTSEGVTERRSGPCKAGEETLNIVVTPQREPEEKQQRYKSTRSATTLPNKIACRSEQWLADIAAFGSTNDIESTNAYVMSRKCIVPPGGRKVTVISRPNLNNKVQFVLAGEKYWTVSSMLKF